MAKRSKMVESTDQTLRTKKLVRTFFPLKYPAYTGKKYSSSICAKRVETFIRAHAERNVIYRKLAAELLRSIIGARLPDDQIVAAVYELKGIFMLLRHTAPLSARGLLKEINLFLSNSSPLKKTTHK